MSSSTTPKMRVGYWWSEKKSQKINVTELARQFVEKGCDFIKIDLDMDLELQGPFDAIIHKLSDVMCKADCDEEAAQKVKSFEEYAERHPDIVIIDSLDNVRKVLDRYRQYKIIDNSELAVEIFTPTFVEMKSTDVAENLQKLQNANVKFPFVCKPILAHGSKYAHKMSIIFNESGLKDINPPCVAQTFINHNARLFKLFIIKDKYFVIERPSIKNFKPNGNENYETVHFDSHDISKPYSSSALTELDEKDAIITEPDKERLDRIVKVISSELGLFLLGIDVIIENETGRYAIIDINSFPGYDGVDNFLDLYSDIVIAEVEAGRRNRESTVTSITKKPQPARGDSTESTSTNNTDSCLIDYCNQNLDHQKPYGPAPTLPSSSSSSKENNSNSHSSSKATNNSDFDSGIDTGDSCDERKHPPPTKSENIGNKKRQHFRQQQQQQSSSTTTASASVAAANVDSTL